MADEAQGSGGTTVPSADTFEFPVDPANVEQASDWGGADGQYWATYHQDYERLLGVFDSALLDAADVGRRDHCLDVGCGTGATTRALAVRAVEGSVIGLDLSGPMLEIARDGALAAGIRNATFVQGDAQVYPFEPASFDVAVSRMGCMFFGDPAAAFANIRRALRPGGRVALAVWQEPGANHWITAIDAALGEDPVDPSPDAPTGYVPGPFALADPSLCTALLEEAGLVDVAADARSIPVNFGTVADAQAFLSTWIDEDYDDEARAQAMTALRRLLEENATDAGVLLPSATWIVTARVP